MSEPDSPWSVFDRHRIAAGIPTNETVLYERRRQRNNPEAFQTPVPKPQHFIDKRQIADRKHAGWNPVYWSDYPKQPAWTVPMPKMAAPVVGQGFHDPPVLLCHRRPTESLYTNIRPPAWVPDIYPFEPQWNPYVSETNTPFRPLLGPPNT